MRLKDYLKKIIWTFKVYTILYTFLNKGTYSVDDILYKKAKEIVTTSQNHSISYLQRKLNISYKQASDLMFKISPSTILRKNNPAKKLVIKIAVIGVGRAGKKFISHINQKDIEDIELILIDTDENIKNILQNIDVIFLLAGFGGSIGSTITPLVAKVANKLGIIVVSIVTLPFGFEGRKKIQLAKNGILELKKYTNSIFVIENDKFLPIIDKTLSLKESFSVIDKTVSEMILNILEPLLIKSDKNINLNFEDIQMVLECKGIAMIAVGESHGDNSVYNAVEQAIKFPLFNDVNILNAMNVLVIMKIHPDFVFMDIEKVLNIFYDNEDISIIFSTSIDDNLALDYVKVTVVATGFEKILNIAVNK